MQKMLLPLRQLTAVSLFLTVLCLIICPWKKSEGHVTGQTPLTTTAFTVNSPSSSGPDLGTFLLRTLSRSCSPVVIPTNDYLDHQWSEIIQNMTQLFDMRYYSCQNRCSVTVEERISQDSKFRCFCDKFCEDLGDCCFDFDALCRTHVNPEISNETCLAVHRSAVHGHTVWNTCPQNWTGRRVRQKCQDEDQNDLLRNLPAFDKDSGVHYRNIFCARCNGAVNTTFWKVLFYCLKSVNKTTFKLGNDMILLPQNCLVAKYPEPYKSTFLHQLKQCIPRFQDCFKINPEKNGSYCQTECLRYAFPVCSKKEQVKFRNIQCALCNGFTLNDLEIQCEYGSSNGISYSLAILFDFSSTSKYTIRVGGTEVNAKTTSTEKDLSCRPDEVYDILAGSCKKIYISTKTQTPPRGNNNEVEVPTVIKPELDEGFDDPHLPSKHNESINWNANCTFIAFNKTDYVLLSNGSVYLKPHNKIYKNMTYMIRDSKLLLCVNFPRNVSITEKAGFSEYPVSQTLASLQRLSAIGCIVSMVSLVLLLITYFLFAELRNLPGKIIINLALSLFLYQSVFLLAVKTDNQNTCLAIAVLLHFFVLSSFTWMNVMAYDVHRIFTTSGGVANRQNRQGSYTRRLIKYCLYAWGSPVMLVLVCVITDHVKKGFIGYGQGEEECFISQPRALLYSFVLPVTLLMIFNLYALEHTVVHIIKTRKRSQQVTIQQSGPSLAVIGVKMASVMGVTWILGIAANLKALSFLWYPYVVLNSLQGLFIFLSFAATGKALELYRSKLTGILKKPATKTEADNSRNHNPSEQLICQADGGQDTQDTKV